MVYLPRVLYVSQSQNALSYRVPPYIECWAWKESGSKSPVTYCPRKADGLTIFSEVIQNMDHGIIAQIFLWRFNCYALVV
jgi:hypothetical protein